MSGLSMLKDQPLTMTAFLLQRQVSNPLLRNALSGCVAGLRPRAAPRDPSREANGARSELAREGVCLLPTLVGSGRAGDMKRYFENFQVRDPYNPSLGVFSPAAAGPQTHVAFFDHATVLHAPHALAIANDGVVLDAVSAALGAKPKITYMAAWWSIPHPGEPRQAENFHRDVDDWRFIKLFVYLTDVDESSGPHSFVRGSHLSPALRRIQRYSDSAVDEAFGTERTVVFTGPAGSSILENTYGLHRGTPPRSRLRLMFQVVYGLSRMPYGPARPICDRSEIAGGEGLDPYINGVYLRR